MASDEEDGSLRRRYTVQEDVDPFLAQYGADDDEEAIGYDNLGADFNPEEAYHASESKDPDDLDGEEDDRSCWNRFKSNLRAAWATRLTEDIKDNRDLLINTTLRELILYIVFLIILTIVCMSHAYIGNAACNLWSSSHVHMCFRTTARAIHSCARGLFNIMARLYAALSARKVIRGPILDAWYDNKWYNDQAFVPAETNLIVGQDNWMIGVPRLRQLRSSYNSCRIPDDFGNQIRQCFASYSIGKQDTRPFGMGDATAWTFTPSSNLSMGLYWGKLAIYDGGGYYVDLAPKREASEKILDKLFQNLWLDRATRALFIQFTIYNPNMNLFCVAIILVEIPGSGGLSLTYDFRTITLIRYVSSSDYFAIVCGIIFLLFTAYYIVEEIMEIYRHRWSYFTSFWNFLDIIIILLSLLCVSFSIYRTIQVHVLLEGLLANKDQFANFDNMSFWQVTYNYTVSIVVFLAWIKIFKYVSFSKTMMQLSTTLGNSAADLFGFSIMFFIVFFAFAELGYLAFGSQVDGFRNFKTAVFTLFRIVLGDFNFAALEQANSVLGPLYFVTYVFFVFFVLLNMFIAIINETYVGVKSDMQNRSNELEVKQFFKKRMKKMLDKMKWKKSRIEKIQKAMELAYVDGGGYLNYTDMCDQLTKKGFSQDEIREVLGKFDTDHDQIFSSTEQLRMKAQLEEEKIVLVNEIAREEQVGLDGSNPFGPPREAEVSQVEYIGMLKRVIRIENGIAMLLEHLEVVLGGLDGIDKSKLIRREVMTQYLQVICDSPTEGRQDKMEQALERGMEQYNNVIDEEL